MKILNNRKYKKLVNPRYISYSYFGTSVVICSLFLFFFIRPTLIEAGKLVQIIKKGKEIDKQLSVKLENLAKVEVIINKNKDLIPLIDQALPDVINSPIFIDNVTNIASGNDIFISTINAESVESVENYGTNMLSFNLNFSGEYNNIIKFIYNLEKSLPVLQTKNISITKNEELYNASLLLSAFGFKYNTDSIGTTIVPLIGDKK